MMSLIAFGMLAYIVVIVSGGIIAAATLAGAIVGSRLVLGIHCG